MIIVNNTKELKKIKFDLKTIDLSIIRKMFSGSNHVFGFTIGDEEYIGRITLSPFNDKERTALWEFFSRMEHGRGQVYATTGVVKRALFVGYEERMLREFKSKLPHKLCDELTDIGADYLKSFNKYISDGSYKDKTIRAPFDILMENALNKFAEYDMKLDSIIRKFLEPLEGQTKEVAMTEVFVGESYQNILYAICVDELETILQKNRLEKEFQEKFKKDLDPHHRIEMLENMYYSGYAYRVDEDGDIDKSMQIFNNNSDLEYTITYYPELRLLDPLRQEDTYSNIVTEDFMYGIDIGTREAPTAIVGDEYIIGKDLSEHEQCGMSWVRNSAVHAGLLFAYLIQRHSPLDLDGYKRTQVDKLLEKYEEHIGVAYGEIYRGNHNIFIEDFESAPSFMYGVDDEEIMRRVKEIVKVNLPINVSYKEDKVLRCDENGNFERFIELAYKEVV